MSEIHKFINLLISYTKGDGLDLGFGGYAIVPTAITVDLDKPYQKSGNHPQNLHGNAANLHWFTDSIFDYVCSSHLLEDFLDTKAVLIEWIRVLKPNGYLLLCLPNQKRYEEICYKRGTIPNGAHKHKDFSLEKVKGILLELNMKIIEEYEFSELEKAGVKLDNVSELKEEYSFIIIAQK